MWKNTKIILMNKSYRDLELSKSYRPVSLLFSAIKTLERLSSEKFLCPAIKILERLSSKNISSNHVIEMNYKRNYQQGFSISEPVVLQITEQLSVIVKKNVQISRNLDIIESKWTEKDQTTKIRQFKFSRI